MIVDTHVHLDSSLYDNNRDDIISLAKQNNISLLINVGVSDKNFSKIKVLSDKYKIVYTAYGIHPMEAANFSNASLYEIENFLKNDKKSIAIGEIGLDFKLKFPEKKNQLNAFISQLEIASYLKKPVIIHCRKAFFKTYEILKKYFKNGIGGIMHSYSGSSEMAKKFIDLGFYISFSGAITYPNAKKPIELIKKLPLNKIVVETDSPYLTPYPFFKEINKPTNILKIIEKIATVKDISIDVLLKKLYKNSITILSL